MRRTPFRSLVCLVLATSISCRTPAGPGPTTPKPAPVNQPSAIASIPTTDGRPHVAIVDDASGLLTVATSDQRVVNSAARVSALDHAETAALQARMEPLPDLSNAPAPTLRPPSTPPPRAGTSQPIAFVVPTGKAVSDSPLVAGKVITPLGPPQITPQGEIRADSEIRIRFSDAMVPVAAVHSVAKPPVTITPAIEGTWRWIDTRVLELTTQRPRLPQATEFTVTVHPGIEAVAGGRLATETTAKFSTPPVAIAGGFPRSTIRPDSPIVVRFDQDIDPAKVLPFVHVTRGKKNVAVPFVTTTFEAARALWARNPSLDLTKLPSTDRTIVLAPKTAWPAGTELQVTLAPGAPSAEGPRLSKGESFTNFAVASAFRVTGISCDDKNTRVANVTCPAKGYMTVEFSNPIAEGTYRSSKLQIVGRELEDNKPSGSRVGIYAPREVGRAFRIAIGEGIEDIYGQPMVGLRALGFVTSPEKFWTFIDAPSGMHVLDPRFEIPQWVAHMQALTSIRVQLYRVAPKDYFAFTAAENDPRVGVPGKKVFDKTYSVGARSGADLRVDLRPALDKSGFGHVVAVATAVSPPGNRRIERTLAWMQVTQLGMQARIDGERINAWIEDITPRDRFLAPRTGVAASLIVDGRETAAGTSDATGHVVLELPPPVKRPAGREPQALLQFAAGPDNAFTAIDQIERTQRVANALWYVTDDRFTYKPGEKLYIKGWVRWTHNGPNPDLSLPKPGDTVAYVLNDASNVKLASGTLAMTDQGGFHAELDLPPNANLGTATLWLSTHNDGYRHPISIQEFRTPAYAVALNDDVSHSGALPLILGESIEMTAGAHYYAGGGLPGAAIDWEATLTTTTFHPAGWSTYAFDPPEPRADRSYYRYRYRYRSEHSTKASQLGSLSGASNASVVYGIAALPEGRPSILEVDATVTDVDRMSIRASSRPILVHPSSYYVGLRLQPGTTSTIEAIVTDIDGNPVAGVPVTVELEGVLGSERFRNDAKVIDTQSCKLTSAKIAVACPWKRKDIKTAYTARATVADPRNRTNVAQFEVPWWSWDDKKDLSIVPDKSSYRPGDVAKLAIHSTIRPATAIVTFARQGVFAQQRLVLTEESTEVRLPIEVGFIQNVHVQVDRYAKRRFQESGSNLPLPETVSAETSLAVDLDSARLDIRAKPSAKLVQPGEQATFDIDVAHRGKPAAGAEVALIVVDEAILALSSKSHPDPLAPFYSELGAGTSSLDSFNLVRDSGDDLAGEPGFTRYSLDGRNGTGSGSGYGSGYGAMGLGAGGGGAGVGIGIVTARKDFRPTAVFSPVLKTDANGHASVTVKMPDSLTRFRIVAIATYNKNYFGKGESTIVTQRKINARTVAPRFLAQGDTFDLPVVVQNLDRKPRLVKVAVRAANLTARGPQGKQVMIPGGQRAEVRFGFATAARGKAAIQTIVVSGAFADASTVQLPVYEPATTESFATYGVVDDRPQREQLAVPASVFTDVGGVEVEVSSTQLQSLTDAYWYLYAYPYECAEQRSGRMLATAAIYDILDAFATPGKPTRAEIEKQRTKDVELLEKTQMADGGWGYFGGMKSNDMVTMQVLQALAAQKIAGAMTKRATAYVTKQADAWFARLAKVAALPAADRKDRADYPQVVSLAAMSLSTLAATGRDIRPRAERLHALATRLDTYPVDAKARVLAILAGYARAKPIRDALKNQLLSVIHETASKASVATEYVESERLLLVSHTKTDALVLDALIRESPDQAVITKLARGVLDGRRHGRWGSTQENLIALQALRRYFDVYEKTTPNYTGKLWLGRANYAEQAFVGRTNVRGEARADWTTLKPGSTHDLAFAKDGPGRMYYRVGITYAPKQVDLPALDAGFIVRRTYTAADDPSDVVKQPDGSYQIKLGAKIVVTLETLNTTTRYGVAVVDPIPAGFESVNTALATSERAVKVDGDDHWDHVNMRDNRSEAFEMYLPAGLHRFTYTVRATTPGRFIAAPTKAEEMYAPETFGRSTGVLVVVQ